MTSNSVRTSLVLAVALLAPACGGGSTSGDDAGGGTDSGGHDASSGDAGATDSSAADGGGSDAGGGDSGGSDAGGTDAGGTDAGNVDAGPACSDSMMGSCAGGLMCLGCPSGPIMEHYLCTTSCTSDTDCTDAARPHCNRSMIGGGTGTGICTTMTFVCTWGAVCASPDTLIATPDGERPIASLREGDLVYSVDHDALVAVPIAMARSVEAEPHHEVVRVKLATGRVVEMSPGHPTADGRLFANLAEGDLLDGTTIVSSEWVPFTFERTYDILPTSDTGTYVAGGVVVGSTLWHPR